MFLVLPFRKGNCFYSEGIAHIGTIEEKIKQIEEKKRMVKARLTQKERKARTKRLIQVGAIFEKYLEIEGPEDAERVAKAFQKPMKENRDKILYPESKERLTMHEAKDEGYKVK